jgi:hypothetical protein
VGKLYRNDAESDYASMIPKTLLLSGPKIGEPLALPADVDREAMKIGHRKKVEAVHNTPAEFIVAVAPRKYGGDHWQDAGTGSVVTTLR